MSIEEIAQYMAHRSIPAFRDIIQTKTSEISDTIRRLEGIQRLLTEKESLLTFCEQADLDAIQLVECPAERLLLSRPISGIGEDDYLATFIEHMQDLRNHRQFNKSYGSMISVEHIMAGDFETDSCFFTRVEDGSQKLDVFVKPKGQYLRAFCKGSWDKLPVTYQRIITFAQERHLTLKGYSYEEGINEMAISSMDEYITQIMILCE